MSHTYINIDSCLATAIALVVLTTIIVFLRLVVRWRFSRRRVSSAWSQHLDDLFCLLALAPTVGVAVAMIYGAAAGVIGGHNDPTHIQNWVNSTTPTLVVLEKLVYIIFIMQPLALGLTKLSFLFFYRRLFIFAGFQITSLCFIVAIVLWMVSFFFGFIFDCGLDFAANWGSLASINEKCPFGFQATIVFAITDAFFDMCILVLPLPWIWRLNLPNARKLQLCGVFSLGGFAVAASVVRMVICIKQNTPSNAADQQYIMGMPAWDIIGITSHGLFWTVVGTNIGLIACCLPILHPIFTVSVLGTVVSSFSCFLQHLRSGFGSKSTKDGRKGRKSMDPDKKASKITIATIGSGAKKSRAGYRLGESNSDVSLVDLGKPLVGVSVEPDLSVSPGLHDAVEMHLEDLEDQACSKSLGI